MLNTEDVVCFEAAACERSLMGRFGPASECVCGLRLLPAPAWIIREEEDVCRPVDVLSGN